jgi:NAD-dependent deacetylase
LLFILLPGFLSWQKNSGARLVIINRESTPKDRLADLVIRGEAGEVMSAILNLLDGS